MRYWKHNLFSVQGIISLKLDNMFVYLLIIIYQKGIKLQKSSTATTFEGTKNKDLENKNNGKEIETRSSILQLLEKEEMDIWVWNNIITRDKMRRKSISGFAPFVNFERRKRYIH